MPPGHVRSIEEYWLWLEQLLDASGATLVEGELTVYPTPPRASKPHQWLLAEVPLHRLVYPSGCYLDFDLAYNVDLEVTKYRFHHAHPSNELIWRLDRHKGHEKHDGGPTHVHVGAEAVRYPYHEVELDEVLSLIRRGQDQGDYSLEIPGLGVVG